MKLILILIVKELAQHYKFNYGAIRLQGQQTIHIQRFSPRLKNPAKISPLNSRY